MSLLGEGTLWVLGAAALGYSISALFSGVFRLRRSTYLLAYIPLAGAFSVTYFQTSAVNVLDLVVDAWPWGLLGAGVVGSLAIKNVLSQPPSPRRSGANLLLDLLWPGLAYGVVDALLLSVLPVVAVLCLAGAASGAGTASSDSGGRVPAHRRAPQTRATPA